MSKENKQWIYIDDSGDPGFKIGSGSSRFFVIACVIFDKKEDATNAVKGVREFKRAIGWEDYRELKSNKTNAQIKIEFFNHICSSCNFKVRVIVIDKTKIYSNELKNNTTSFYNYVIRQVLSKTELNQAKIVLDGHADRNYKKQAISYIRKNAGGQGRISAISFEDSSKNNLIQIADMVAGIIRREKEGLSDGGECLKILDDQGKIDDIWFFR